MDQSRFDFLLYIQKSIRYVFMISTFLSLVNPYFSISIKKRAEITQIKRYNNHFSKQIVQKCKILAKKALDVISKKSQFRLKNEVHASFYENITNSVSIEAFISILDQSTILIIIVSMHKFCLLYLMLYFIMYYKREVVHFNGLFFPETCSCCKNLANK